MKNILSAIAATMLVFNLHAQELPKTQLRDVNSGKAVAFNEACEKGKVTLVCFWGTWCAHGKRQVKTIFQKMSDWKKQADFNFIVIAEDENRGDDLIRTYARAQGWTFPCYVDPNSELKPLLHFQALPYTMVIDKKGNVVHTHTGYETGEEILAKLKKLADGHAK